MKGLQEDYFISAIRKDLKNGKITHLKVHPNTRDGFRTGRIWSLERLIRQLETGKAARTMVRIYGSWKRAEDLCLSPEHPLGIDPSPLTCLPEC